MIKDISVSLRWNTAIRHTYKEQELFGKEEKMYTFDSRVRYSEIDHTGNMTLPALINYFQDCSTFQSEDIGLGTEVLKAKKKAGELTEYYKGKEKSMDFVLLADRDRTSAGIGRAYYSRNLCDGI